MSSPVRPQPGTGPEYTPAGYFMLRAATLPVEVFTHLTDPSPDGGIDDGTAEGTRLDRLRSQGRNSLWALAARPRIRHAIHAASTSLANRLAALGDRPPAGRQAERTYSSLLRYLTRMSTRATPMGLFAGVATGRFTAETDLVLHADPLGRTRTRADCNWLTQYLAQLGADPATRTGLPVRPNDLLHRHVDRAVVVNSVPDGREQVSLRLTAPVEHALHLAATGTTYGELADELTAAYPRAGRDRILAMLDQMWRTRAIIADLHAPMTSPIPEAYAADRLAASPGLSGAVDDLRGSRRIAARVDAAHGKAGASLLAEYEDYHRKLVPGFDGPVYQTDAALAVRGSGVSAQIAAAAGEAGTLAMRLYSTTPRLGHIADYHHVFLERYGAGSEVPLLEVISPERGIGPPNGYRNPPRRSRLPERPEPRHLRRDQALADLAVTAARQGRIETPLSDADLEALTVWRDDDPYSTPISSLELFVKIAAESREAIDEGHWRMILSPGMFRGLQTFGRFGDLLDDGFAAELREFAREEQARQPDVVIAELNTEAWEARRGNLMVRPALRDYEIVVNSTPTLPENRRITLPDVLVGADGHGFYLRSARLGKRLLVVRSHAVIPYQAPNVCRAMLDLSTDKVTAPSFFNWGPMGESPFLPRLTRGRIVLSTASWALPRHLGAEGDRDRFFAAVEEWRREWGVPRHVHLTVSDNRLLLDLEHPLSVDELQREARRVGSQTHSDSIRLHEMLPDFSELWLRDDRGRRYQSELVVSVMIAGGDETAPPAPEAPQRLRETKAARRWMPGDEWVYLKLYTADSQQEEVIAGPLRRFTADLRERGLVGPWFYIRYVDPHDHLRVRLRAVDREDAGAVMARCASWARGLVEAGLASDFAFVSYDREMERYGGPEAIDAVERAFHANSELTSALLAQLPAIGIAPEVAGVVALHRLCESWGADPLAYITTREHVTVSEEARLRFRGMRPLLCELLVPGQPGAGPSAASTVATLEPLFAQQHHTVSEAGELVRKLEGDRRLLGTEHLVLDSLLHMQANRIFGVDGERERLYQGLWRLAARAIANRPARKP